jgi:hypothetical protein
MNFSIPQVKTHVKSFSFAGMRFFEFGWHPEAARAATPSLSSRKVMLRQRAEAERPLAEKSSRFRHQIASCQSRAAGAY